MSTRRTTHDKRQRERSKQQKAAAKREKRQGRSDEESDEPREDGVADDIRDSTEELLARIETLHANYDAGNVPFEEFEEQRAELLDRIALRLAQ